MYVIALMPYVVLLILGIFAFTIDGATDGAAFLFTPDLDKLLSFKPWKAAGSK